MIKENMRWLDAKNLIVILTDDYRSVFPFFYSEL